MGRDNLFTDLAFSSPLQNTCSPTSECLTARCHPYNVRPQGCLLQASFQSAGHYMSLLRSSWVHRSQGSQTIKIHRNGFAERVGHRSEVATFNLYVFSEAEPNAIAKLFVSSTCGSLLEVSICSPLGPAALEGAQISSGIIRFCKIFTD